MYQLHELLLNKNAATQFRPAPLPDPGRTVIPGLHRRSRGVPASSFHQGTFPTARTRQFRRRTWNRNENFTHANHTFTRRGSDIGPGQDGNGRRAGTYPGQTANKTRQPYIIPATAGWSPILTVGLTWSTSNFGGNRVRWKTQARLNEWGLR